MAFLRACFLLIFVVLLASKGQAKTHLEEISELYSAIDQEFSDVIFCNTPEFRTKVQSFLSECRKSELEDHCSTTAPALLEEARQCMEYKKEKERCAGAEVNEVPSCLPLLKKEWELLGKEHAPCRDKVNQDELKHVMENCQNFEGLEEDAQSRCVNHFFKQLFTVDACWTIVNLDVPGNLGILEEIEKRFEQDIPGFERKGLTACVYRPKVYLKELRDCMVACHNAKTVETQYECRQNAYLKYTEMPSDAATLCEAYEQFVVEEADTDLNTLYSQLQEGFTLVAKDKEGNLDEGRCPAVIYSAADAAVRNWAADKDDKKKENHRAEILEAVWGLALYCSLQYPDYVYEASVAPGTDVAAGETTTVKV